jgi:phage baseplate assembly protein W
MAKATTSPGTIWSEIDPRFIADGKGNLKVSENFEAVYGSIDNILRTRKAERVMLRQFGSGIIDLLGEPINGALMKLMVRNVKNDIESWDDRLSVVQLNITPDYNNGAVAVNIYFQIRGYGNQVFQYQANIKGE